MKSKKKTNGFTLIELLIVVAIIGLLGSLLFRVVDKNPNTARTQCKSQGGVYSEINKYGSVSTMCSFPKQEH